MYKPVKFKEKLFSFVLPTDVCAICGCDIMYLNKRAGFSRYYSQEQQMAEAGIRPWGASIPGTDKEVCKQCLEEDKVRFICQLCGIERRGSQLHEEEYQEPVCVICYETVPAKQWAEHEKARWERHKYDYD